MKNKLKNSRGITLIALVISIIVILLLAGLTIATLTGDNRNFITSTKSEGKYRGSKI